MAIDIGLQGKPWYVGFIIGLILAALIVVGVHYGLVTDINKQIASNDAKLDELQKKIEAGRAAEKKLPQFREEVKRLELELDKLRRILPSSRNTEEIIKKIKSLVDQGDFILKKLVFPPLQQPEGGEAVYAEWPISVSLDGGYHDLAILFNRLGNFSRIINVEQFTITALNNQTDRTITCDFVAKTFVYVEPKDTSASATGTPGGTTTGAPGGTTTSTAGK